MADSIVYKADEVVRHSGATPVLVQREQPDAVTTVERRIYLEKNEKVSATHRTIVEIRTSLDTFDKSKTADEAGNGQQGHLVQLQSHGMQVEGNGVQVQGHGAQVQKHGVQLQGRAPILQYRVVPKIKEIEVPDVQVEYEDTYVEVPVPFELPIIAPRQVPVEQIVQRNIPKPISVHTKQRFRMPRIQPKYYDVKVPIYVPSYVEVPIPSHFVALKDGECFPEELELGPAIPHLPSCPVLPDLKGRERYTADIKAKKIAASLVTERLREDAERVEAQKVLVDSTAGLPALHRRGSQGSDLGYSSSALVRGAYPSVEFVAVSTNTSLSDLPQSSAKEKGLQLEEPQLAGKGASDDGSLDVEEQSGMEREASGEETASEYLGNKMNDFNSSEEGGATPALSASPALVHAAA